MTRNSLIIFCLLLALSAVAEAGRLKGFKKQVLPTERDLKKSESDKKSKKEKKKGPKKRTCKSPVGTVITELSPKSAFACKTPDFTMPLAPADESGRKLQEKDEGEVNVDTNETSVVEDNNVTASTEQIEDEIQFQDEIKYVIETSDNGIKVSVGYNSDIEEGSSSEIQSNVSFEFQFENLVEYVKADGSNDEAYDWNTDEVVQVVPFTSWSGIAGNISHEEGMVLFFTATANLSSSDDALASKGSVEFNFTVSDTSIGNLDANSVRIDVQILDFPWTRNTSYIALLSSVHSTKNLMTEYNTQAIVSNGNSQPIQSINIDFEEQLQELGLEVFGEYTWEAVTDAQPDDDANTTIEDQDVTTLRGSNVTFLEGSDAFASEGANVTTLQVIATSPTEGTPTSYHQIAYSFVGDAAHEASALYWSTVAGVAYYELPQEEIVDEFIVEEEVEEEAGVADDEDVDEEVVEEGVVEEEVVEEETEEAAPSTDEGQDEKEEKPKPGKERPSKDDSAAQSSRSFGVAAVLLGAVLLNA